MENFLQMQVNSFVQSSISLRFFVCLSIEQIHSCIRKQFSFGFLLSLFTIYHLFDCRLLVLIFQTVIVGLYKGSLLSKEPHEYANIIGPFST